MRAHLGGPQEVGAGPVAELGSGCCCSLPGERPFDRWDRSVASETRSAGSCGGDRSTTGQSHHTTTPTSSTMTSWCSSDHTKSIILNHLQPIYFYNCYSLKSLLLTRSEKNPSKSRTDMCKSVFPCSGHGDESDTNTGLLAKI